MMSVYSLCPELLDHIFSFLPTQDLCAAAKACSAWSQVAMLSLRRRIYLDRMLSGNVYKLRAETMESFIPSKRVSILEAESSEFRVRLEVPSNQKHPLHVVMAMDSDWCGKISELDFESPVTVEQWNVFGASVMAKFPNLKKLNLKKVVWLPVKENEHIAEFHAGYKRYGQILFSLSENQRSEEPHFEGRLRIQVDDRPLLAVTALASEWCSKITKLQFQSIVAIEDLNTAGASLLSPFPSLKNLSFLNLVLHKNSTGEIFCQMWLQVPALEREGTLLIDTKKRRHGIEPKFSSVFMDGRWCFVTITKPDFQNELTVFAAVAISDEWCSRISKLELGNNDIVVQDWSVAGSVISNKFSNLKELKVKLKWVPGYVSTIKVHGDQLLQVAQQVEEVKDSFEKKDSAEKQPGNKDPNLDQKRLDSTQSLLALSSMNSDSCTKITHLRLQTELAVQDWNVAGTQVLSKFSSLKQLNLKLIFIQDYVSSIEAEILPAEAVFHNLETLDIDLSDHLNIDPLEIREELSGDFVTRCPNLKRLHLSYQNICKCGCSPPLLMEFDVAEKKHLRFHVSSCDSHAWSRNTNSSDLLISIGTALAPLLNTLQFTSLFLDSDRLFNNLQFLEHLNPEAAQRLTSLEIQLTKESKLANGFRILLTLLHRQGCTSLESLHLVSGYRENFELPLSAAENCETAVQLPKVKKLTIALSESKLVYDDPEDSIHGLLVRALPNLEELDASSKVCSPIFDPFGCDLHVMSGRFLKYSAQFTMLRHLKWKWNFYGSFEPEWLMSIRENLAKHEALESLSVSLTGNNEPALEVWKTIVTGCAAAPHIRMLQVLRIAPHPPYTPTPLLPLVQLWFNRLATRPDGMPRLQLRIIREDNVPSTNHVLSSSTVSRQ